MTRRRQSLNGLWRYAPQAHQVLKPGGVLEESTAGLPPGGEMQIPCNWQLGGLDNFHGSVRFGREFIFTPHGADGAGVWLVFQAVDYQARGLAQRSLPGRTYGLLCAV